jgi:hypothetical protein
MILLTVLSDMNEVFTAFFFGNGHWLGLILMISLILGLVMAFKYSVVLMLPVAIVFGTEYLTNGLGWDALIMFLTGIFILVYFVMNRGKK